MPELGAVPSPQFQQPSPVPLLKFQHGFPPPEFRLLPLLPVPLLSGGRLFPPQEHSESCHRAVDDERRGHPPLGCPSRKVTPYPRLDQWDEPVAKPRLLDKRTFLNDPHFLVLVVRLRQAHHFDAEGTVQRLVHRESMWVLSRGRAKRFQKSKFAGLAREDEEFRKVVLGIIDDEVIMKFDKRLGEASQYYDTES